MDETHTNIYLLTHSLTTAVRFTDGARRSLILHIYCMEKSPTPLAFGFDLAFVLS